MSRMVSVFSEADLIVFVSYHCVTSVVQQCGNDAEELRGAGGRIGWCVCAPGHAPQHHRSSHTLNLVSRIADKHPIMDESTTERTISVSCRVVCCENGARTCASSEQSYKSLLRGLPNMLSSKYRIRDAAPCPAARYQSNSPDGMVLLFGHSVKDSLVEVGT